MAEVPAQRSYRESSHLLVGAMARAAGAFGVFNRGYFSRGSGFDQSPNHRAPCPGNLLSALAKTRCAQFARRFSLRCRDHHRSPALRLCFLASARHPAYNWGNVSSLHDLLALIARRSYGSMHLVSTPGYSGGSALARILALVASFGSLAMALSFLGFLQAFRRQSWYAWFVLIAFLGVGPFFVAITNLDLATAPRRCSFWDDSSFCLTSWSPPLRFRRPRLPELFRASASRQLWERVIAAVILLAVAGNAARHYRRIDQKRNFMRAPLPKTCSPLSNPERFSSPAATPSRFR